MPLWSPSHLPNYPKRATKLNEEQKVFSLVDEFVMKERRKPKANSRSFCWFSRSSFSFIASRCWTSSEDESLSASNATTSSLAIFCFWLERFAGFFYILEIEIYFISKHIILYILQNTIATLLSWPDEKQKATMASRTSSVLRTISRSYTRRITNEGAFFAHRSQIATFNSFAGTSLSTQRQQQQRAFSVFQKVKDSVSSKMEERNKAKQGKDEERIL